MKLLISLMFILFIPRSYALKIAVISDLNSSYGSMEYHPAVKRSIEQILDLKPDLVISTGDMIAGQKPGLNYLGMWEVFHQTVTTAFEHFNIPFVVTPGNHDGSLSLKFHLEREIYRQQWMSHRPNLFYIHAENYPDYYAFVLNNNLFVSLDATLTSLSEKQMLWLEKVLTETVNYRHKIVFGHLPVFATAKVKASEVLQNKKLETLFIKTKVSAYLSGHHHTYYPGKKDGVKYIAQACLGSGPRSLIGSDKISSRAFTLIDLEDSVTVEAYNADKNFELIDKKFLPERINYNHQEIFRDDL